MKRILSTSTAVASVLLAAACGTSVAATPAPTSPSSTTSTAPAPAAASPTDTTQGTSPDGTNPNADAGPEGTATGAQLGVTPANGRAAMGQDIAYSNGVTVHVGTPHMGKVTQDTGFFDGDPNSAVVFPVTITNGSADRLAGDDIMVSLLAGSSSRLANLAGDSSQGWDAGFPKVIAPGRTVTQMFSFAVRPAEAKNLEVQASPDGGINYLMGLWAGGVS